jgi:hypothetical protein
MKTEPEPHFEVPAFYAFVSGKKAGNVLSAVFYDISDPLVSKIEVFAMFLI